MAETEQKDQETPKDGESGKVTFTPEQQEFIDKLLTERLGREKAKSEKAKEEAVEAARAEERESIRIANLQGEEKAKATHEAQMKAKEKENAKLAEELKAERFKSAKMTVAAKLAGMGLPTDDVFVVNLIGETEEATNQAIQAFSTAFNDAVTKAVDASINHGAPKLGTGANAPSWKSEIDAAMKL